MKDIIEFVQETDMANCECKGGLYFRGVVNDYFDGNKLVFKKELRFLKRKSCKCSKCSWLLGEISEYLHVEIIQAPKIKDGAIYTPIITNIHRDFETGYVDDFDIIFKEVVE